MCVSVCVCVCVCVCACGCVWGAGHTCMSKRKLVCHPPTEPTHPRAHTAAPPGRRRRRTILQSLFMKLTALVMCRMPVARYSSL